MNEFCQLHIVFLMAVLNIAAAERKQEPENQLTNYAIPRKDHFDVHVIHVTAHGPRH